MLGGFFHCSFIGNEERDNYIQLFQKRLRKKLAKAKKDDQDAAETKQTDQNKALHKRHSGSV